MSPRKMSKHLVHKVTSSKRLMVIYRQRLDFHCGLVAGRKWMTTILWKEGSLSRGMQTDSRITLKRSKQWNSNFLLTTCTESLHRYFFELLQPFPSPPSTVIEFHSHMVWQQCQQGQRWQWLQCGQRSSFLSSTSLRCFSMFNSITVEETQCCPVDW